MRGVGTNSAVVTSVKTVDIGIADVNGFCASGAPLDPLNTIVVTTPVANIAGAYEFYRLRAASVALIPTGGSTAVGSINWCYISNPEIAFTYYTSTVLANKQAIVAAEEGSESASLQESLVKPLRPNRVYSRQWYSTNTTLSSAQGATDFDRSIQSYFAYTTRGSTASVSVPGRLQFSLTYELRGLGNAGAYTLNTIRLTDDWSYRVPFTPAQQDDWPNEVVLVSRQSGEKRYSLPPAPKPPPPEESATHRDDACQPCVGTVPGSNLYCHATRGNPRRGQHQDGDAKRH